MALTQVTGPYPIFTDLDGSPLDDGYLYIGEINQDPEANPIQVYWDANLTIPASQPIRTNSGYAWRNGTPGLIYTGSQFSITIRNKRQEFVLYSPVGYGFDPGAVSASVVTNDFTGDGVEVDFTLSASPSTKLATNVFINGVYQEKDSYSLSGNVITFSVAPPLSSSIEIMTNETGVINSGNATAISYTAGFPGATQQTVQTKLEQYVSVKDFGAVGDGVTDDTAAIQAARDYAEAQTVPPAVVFPAGTYLYSASPNWAFFDATVIADGEVFLRYTGTDYAVVLDAGLVQTIYNVNFLGPFVVQATAAAKGGYYVRSVHHSKIEGRVDGCGASYFGLSVLFSVCSEFNVTTSNNSAGGWYSGAQPSGGIYLSRRDPGELVTACTFNNPIVEGVSGDGIVLDYASNNIFIGGTSEGNGGAGISLTANSIANNVYGTDFEQNTGDDIYDAGSFNSFTKINSTNNITFLGSNAKLTLSTVNDITDNGGNTIISDTVYSLLGGSIAGTGTDRAIQNVLNASGQYDQNKTYDSVIANSVSVTHNTATTVLTLTNVGSNRFYNVVAYNPTNGAAYAAYALVYRDGTNAYIISQTNGANLSITLSGLNVQVTQTSGITLNVSAKAAAI